MPLNEDQRRLVTEVVGFPKSLLATVIRRISKVTWRRLLLSRLPKNIAIEDWRRAIGISCKRILRPYLDSFKGYSVCENPALALPTLFGYDQDFDEARATHYLREYLRMLHQIKAESVAADSADATEFLEALADYGNYYDLIAAMRDPPMNPSS